MCMYIFLLCQFCNSKERLVVKAHRALEVMIKSSLVRTTGEGILRETEEPQHRMSPFDLMLNSLQKALAVENAKARTWLNMSASIAFAFKGKLPNLRE